MVLLNPVIVGKSEGVDYEVEGCLSFPEMNGEVMRHKWVKVEAMNLKVGRWPCQIQHPNGPLAMAHHPFYPTCT